MFFRLKPYNPKLGQLLKSYSLKGKHFVAGGPAIEVDDPDHIARLKAARNVGPKEALAFEASERPFDEEEEEEVAQAASPVAQAASPAPAVRGKPGPKPGSKRGPKADRGTVPSLAEAE